MAFIESSGGCAPRSARGIQQSSLERAFSGVYTVCRRVRAPKRAWHRTEQSGECVLWRLERSRGCAPRSARGLPQSSLERAFGESLVAFRVKFRAFQRVPPKRARPPTEQPGECVYRVFQRRRWPRSARGVPQSTLESKPAERVRI